MKDSSTGAIGTIAILFVILLKYLSLKNLSHFLPFTYYSSLLLMPVFSKWAMVVSMLHGKAAREDGLGKIFMNKTGFKETAISTLLLILILILIQALSSRYALENQHVFYAILFGVLYPFCRILVYFFNKKIWRADRRYAWRDKRAYGNSLFIYGDNMVTTLYLIRHGETEGSEIKRYKGSIDVPMSEKGN